MKIVFAADGSKYTKKALTFLVTHESMAGPEDEIFALNLQATMPSRVKRMLGSAEVLAYQREGAHMLVMGTHSHSLMGRALMGSVAYRVIADCDVPVILVK